MKKLAIGLMMVLTPVTNKLCRAANANEVSVQINVSNIRNSKGVLRLALFNTQESFVKEKPFKSVTLNKDNLNNGNINIKVMLPQGIYGITVLDDENSNAKMDYNFVGVPKEGFGFSNYYHTGYSKPVLNQFTIEVKEGLLINCKMRYM